MKATVMFLLNVALILAGVWVANAHPAVGAIGGVVLAVVCAFAVQIQSKYKVDSKRTKFLIVFYALVSVGSILHLM